MTHLDDAQLALTVIRNPPSGQIVLDDGATVVGELKSWYPTLVNSFGEPALLAAASREHGRPQALPCAFCYARALALSSGDASPRITTATIELLGKPCVRCMARQVVEDLKEEHPREARFAGARGNRSVLASADLHSLPSDRDIRALYSSAGDALRELFVSDMTRMGVHRAYDRLQARLAGGR